MQQTIRKDREADDVNATGRRRCTPARAPGGPFAFPPNMAFAGEMVIDGDVVIDHVQDGFIEARNVHIGPQADVAGTVVGVEVVVEGRIEGAIYAERIVLTPSAVVEGELWFRELELSSGVWFEGKSRRVENPRTLAGRLPRRLNGLAL
jgi:cytoskeletal protein CcmA (bactofilin family)